MRRTRRLPVAAALSFFALAICAKAPESSATGHIDGPRVRIRHQNKLGAICPLIELRYAIDGSTIYKRPGYRKRPPPQSSFDVFRGVIVPGKHTLEVDAVCRLGGFGIFRYVHAWRLRLRKRRPLLIKRDRPLAISVRLESSGKITTPITKRLRVTFVIERRRQGSRRPARRRAK